MTQIGLFDKPGMEERFKAYHAAHPEVYAELLALAYQWGPGKRWSINGMFEVLRWQRWIATRDEREMYLLNNNYRAFYARLIMREHPDLDGMFELRVQPSRFSPRVVL